MTEGDVGQLFREAMMIVVKLGGPPLMVALAAGLVASVIQAATQINEPTLALVPKVAAICATLYMLGSFMLTTLGDFTRMLFDRLVAVGGS